MRCINLLLRFVALLTLVALAGPVRSQALNNAWDLPPVVLDDPAGVSHNLYDWHGKVIMLNFWASWCKPCQAEIPHLIAWQKQYREHNLQVIGIGIDEPVAIRNFIRTFGIDYPVLIAESKTHADLLPGWGNPKQVLPYTIVIDRDGSLHFAQTGILEQEVFEDYVLPLLDKVSDDSATSGK